METQKNESQDNSFNSAHFGSPSLHSQKNEISIENNHEILIQLAKSNDTTKKLAVVFSGMVSKIKQLEEDNNKLKMENDELLKMNTIKERIILEKNCELEEKEKKIENLLEHSLRLEKDLIKNRAKISQAMNMAFEKGAPELVEFIERDILSVSSKT